MQKKTLYLLDDLTELFPYLAFLLCLVVGFCIFAISLGHLFVVDVTWLTRSLSVLLVFLGIGLCLKYVRHKFNQKHPKNSPEEKADYMTTCFGKFEVMQITDQSLVVTESQTRGEYFAPFFFCITISLTPILVLTVWAIIEDPVELTLSYNLCIAIMVVLLSLSLGFYISGRVSRMKIYYSIFRVADQKYRREMRWKPEYATNHLDFVREYDFGDITHVSLKPLEVGFRITITFKNGRSGQHVFITVDEDDAKKVHAFIKTSIPGISHD